MNIINKYMLGNGTDKNKDFMWNMLGSGVYAVAAVLLSFLTIRIVGEVQGGIFAISITLSQLLMYISYFELRNYQITDSNDEYEFKYYYTAKIILSILMMVISGIYIFIRDYSFYKGIIIFLVCFYRMTDGFADVFESQFHKDGRLDVAGKSLTLRTIITILTYFIFLISTKSIIVAMLWTCLIAMICVYIVTIIPFKYSNKICVTNDYRKVFGLIKKAFPLFVAMFLWSYLLSASRIAIDANMTEEYQSYYQILFLPVSVINLVAGFIFRPILVELTDMHKKNEIRKFFGLIIRNMLVVMCFTIACMFMAYIIGIPILSALTACDLTDYRWLLVFLILSGGINAMSIILYYILTIYRNRVAIMLGYIIAAAFAGISSNIMVKNMGLWGGALSFMLTAVLLIIVFTMAVIIGFSKRK